MGRHFEKVIVEYLTVIIAGYALFVFVVETLSLLQELQLWVPSRSAFHLKEKLLAKRPDLVQRKFTVCDIRYARNRPLSTLSLDVAIKIFATVLESCH